MPLRIRFRIYNPPTSSFFSSMSDNFGWYIDDITFSNVEVLVEGITSEGTNPQWTFSSPDRHSTRAQIINNTTPTHQDQVCASKLSMPLPLARHHWYARRNNWYSSWMDYYFASTTAIIGSTTILSDGSTWGVSGNGAWYYDSALGWLWTTSSEYPYSIKATANGFITARKPQPSLLL